MRLSYSTLPIIRYLPCPKEILGQGKFGQIHISSKMRNVIDNVQGLSIAYLQDYFVVF